MPFILNEQQMINQGNQQAAGNLANTLSQIFANRAKREQLAQQGEIEAAQRQADVNTAVDLQNKLGPDRNVHVGSASVGGRDPLRDMERARALQQPSLTPGQEAADRAFGKQYTDYQATGGKEGVDKSLQDLEFAKQSLKNATKYDQAVGIFPKSLRDFLAPAATAREDAVRTAIQSTLKQRGLDSQFAAKEAELIMERSYNPRQPAEENMRRIDSEIQSMKAKADKFDQSAKHFEQKGTLKGLLMPTKKVIKTEVSPSTGKKRITYSDGTQEIQ